jgi:hypothetical protein
MFVPYKTILRQLLIDWNYRTVICSYVDILHANIACRRRLSLYAHASLTLPSYFGVYPVFL